MNNKNTKRKLTLSSLLKEAGFVLPVNEEDLKKYDNTFGNTDVILPEEFDNPDFIFSKSEGKEASKITKVISINTADKNEHKSQAQRDYFKKLVLAAEIANSLYTESTFGHKKFVKIYYLCNEVCNMQLSANYGQYAAGPLDPKHLYSVDAEFKKRKWFKVIKRLGGYGYRYEPDININDYKKYFPNYFKNHAESINRIIELFRKESSDSCEIVATIFFIWKKALSNNLIIDNNLLITHFYEWGEQKKRFDENRLLKSIDWMNQKQVVPIF